jgi:DNA-binding NarL/FixJ family response regulator
MKRITVLLAEDHAIVREGFRKLLDLDAGLEVVGEAREGRQAVALAKQLQPEVVLMDIDMPFLNGLEATRQVLEAVPATKVLILSAYSHDEYVKGAADSGAVGFLPKQTSSDDVCLAIRQVQEGKTLFDSLISNHLDPLNSRLPQRTELSDDRGADLTSRQIEVLQRIATGKTNREIALELGIGLKTVQKHREHLMKKLDIHNSAGLTRYAINAGLL